MYFSRETLAANSRLVGHWNELWANRNMWNAQHNAMIATNRAHTVSYTHLTLPTICSV